MIHCIELQRAGDEVVRRESCYKNDGLIMLVQRMGCQIEEPVAAVLNIKRFMIHEGLVKIFIQAVVEQA